MTLFISERRKMSTRTVLGIFAQLGTSKPEKFYELMAQFTGALRHPTVQRWFVAECAPVGIFYIKVMFFFELLGYKVNQLEFMKEAGSYWISKSLAFGLISLEEISQGTGYPVHSVMRVITGRCGISQEKQEKLERLAAPLREKLDSSAAVWQEKLKSFSAKETKGEPVKKTQRQPNPLENSGAETVNREKARVITMLAAHIKAALPLADLVLGDDFTPQDREKVRALAGFNGVFLLSNRLNSLCGETARNNHTS